MDYTFQHYFSEILPGQLTTLMYKNIYLDDNCFEVLFCELKTKKDIIRSLYHMKNRDITTAGGFKFYKAKRK